MKNDNDFQPELDFDTGEIVPEFFNKIKAEYLKWLYLVYILLAMLIFIYIAHQFLIEFYNQMNLQIILIQIITWTMFISYLIIHFFLLTYNKFSPTLVKFLTEELQFLGFKAQRKYKKGFDFLIFNSFSVLLFILISIGFSISIDYLITFLLIRLIIIYMILAISIPMLRGLLHDKLIVRLRPPYFIQLEIQLKLLKRKENESQMVRIYMTSRKLGLKSDQALFRLYNEISEKKWLPRKGRSKIHTFLYDPHLYFREYSNLINFKEHFLNLVSAIREWDIQNPKSAE
ncbi:MAG: hypothetical protein ACFE9S_11960 [Candidatus Hermodarchaeota archaeon]